MGRSRRLRALRALVGVAVGPLLVLTACGGDSEPLSGSDAKPPPRRAVPETVDVCSLVPVATASHLLERAMVVVGRSVGAARNTTVSCEIGDRFGEPVVTVSLAPDPIAKDVFEAAYGTRAGGNPRRSELGDEAFLRTEDTFRVLRVYVRGAVVSVQVPYGPPGRESVSVVQLQRLTRTAVQALPNNPAIEPTTAPPLCGDIDEQVLADTLGRSPSLDTGLQFGDGALTCSWSGQPGSVALWMTDRPAEIARFLDRHQLSPAMRVAGVLSSEQGFAYSSPSAAGDLTVVLSQDRAVMTSEVIPAAGYADDGIDTSDSERAVAKAGLALLDRLH